MVDATSPYLSQQRENKKKTPIIIIGAVILAVVVGGIIMSRQPKKTDQTVVSVVEKKGKEPSPTEGPKIDKKSVKIQVLNGTGTPGQAGDTVEALKKAGYNSDNIKTDNAEEFNNLTTTISARKGFEDVASDMKDALKETFDEIKIDSSPLEDGSEFDIVIVTGGKIYEDITPTVSATGSPTSSVTATPIPTSTPSPTLTPTPTP